MLSAAELIECLQSRMRRHIRAHGQALGTFPPTWRAWMLAQERKQGEIVGAPAMAYVAEFEQREPAPPAKAEPPLGRWAAFRRLWRQQWGRAPFDQRRMRRIAAITSLLFHLFFAIFWLTLAPVYVPLPKQDDALGEAIQIEYIGDGTAEEVGAAPGDSPSPPGDVAGATTAATGGEAAPPPNIAEHADVAVPEAAQTPMPVESPTETKPDAAQPVEQPLVVTQTEEPDSDFVLPPPVVRQAETERLTIREAEVTPATAQIDIDEPRPAVRQRQADTTAPQLVQPTLQTTPQDIELREPLPEVRRMTRTQPAPELRMPDAPATSNGIVLREPPTQTGQATATGTQTAGAPSTNPSAPAPRNAAAGATTAGNPAPPLSQGRPTGAARAGVGESRSPNPGAVPSVVRDDDWGAAARTRPGSAPSGRGDDGVFGADGSVRIPNGGRVGGGLPPGTIIEDFERIDRMGTWLKRPPIDYTPSRFDPFWRPSETLLEEWVRRGVKEVLIPIPGTSKKVRCVVSLLQAAGGCTVTDPNLQDQEAVARKPPPVPFKPELQEDQDSLKK